jgi:Recombinase zinc beta ribbon domain
VSAAHGGGDPGQPEVHRPSGAEPAADDFDLVDPGNTGLGHRQVQRWNLPEGWVISRRPAHPALVSEADFIAAQDVTAPSGPASPAVRRYLLAGLLACGRCGRRLESAWSNGRPAYRCRHGYTSAAAAGPGRLRNTYVREDEILPHLAALAILLAADGQPGGNGTVQVTDPPRPRTSSTGCGYRVPFSPTTRTPAPSAPPAATPLRSPQARTAEITTPGHERRQNSS